MPEKAGGEVFFYWLEHTAIAVTVRQSTWLYPVVETVHILGFVTLIGSVIMFDLRLLGFARQLPVNVIMRHHIHWASIGLTIVIPAGFILFMTEATSLIENSAFLLKLILIGMAGINATVFHLVIRKTVDRWNLGTAPPFAAKAAGFLSLLLWASVITCGRFIAYI